MAKASRVQARQASSLADMEQEMGGMLALLQALAAEVQALREAVERQTAERPAARARSQAERGNEGS